MRIGKGTPLRLPTKSKAKAQDRYKTVLQRSLTCIIKTAIWYTALTGIEKGEFVLLLSESPVKLYRLNGDPVFLSATQNFHLEKDHRFVGEWKVKTDRYEYTLSFHHLSRRNCSPGTGTRARKLNLIFMPTCRLQTIGACTRCTSLLGELLLSGLSSV